MKSLTDTIRRLAILSVATVPAVLLLHGITQTSSVRCHGKLDVPQTYLWNLDDGEVGHMGQPEHPPMDFWYEAVNSTTRYLVPLHGASLAVMGDKSVGYAGCSSANLSQKKIDVGTLNNGSFLCAKTSSGRFAELSFDRLYVEQPTRQDVLTLAITYTTWER